MLTQKTGLIQELKKICNFLKISPDKEKVQKIVNEKSFESIPTDSKGSGKVTRSARPGKWIENFSDEEKLKVNKIMKDMLLNLGYQI